MALWTNGPVLPLPAPSLPVSEDMRARVERHLEVCWVCGIELDWGCGCTDSVPYQPSATVSSEELGRA